MSDKSESDAGPALSEAGEQGRAVAVRTGCTSCHDVHIARNTQGCSGCHSAHGGPLTRESFLATLRGRRFDLGGLQMDYTSDNQGSDLVVTAIWEGRQAAEGILDYLEI